VTKALAGRYMVERVLGEGGMATVYLAEDQKHRRKVAVKVMRPELAATLGADRFLREVQIAAQLSHPHILPMHDSGEADGLLYYVMPYVEGETLKERLEREGALAPEEALKLAREVAEALAYAHRRGIIHRDIKPANIMMSEGHALVADFGIARAVEDVGGESLTKTGLAIGTPQYMAPEQATGEKAVDGRADVYATGAILYEMLTGEPPFTGSNARAILTKSLTERPRAVTQVRTGLTPALDGVVQKALEKSADERYASAIDFVAALDSARTLSSASLPAITPPQATQTMPAPRAPSGRRNLAIAAIVLLALVGGWFGLRGKARAPATPGSNRLAVLPFENQGAPADDYFADGIADEVRGKLANVKGIAVIASASAKQYKGSTKAPKDIARELGADFLLTGKVRYAGTGAARRVQVVPELIDANSGDVKWQQNFDADLTDVFKVQSEIASRVVGALGVALAGTEQAELARRPTDNVEAYQLYLKGRSVVNTDPASLREAVGFLEQAVTLDANFTEAWALLSMQLSRLYVNGNRDPAVSRRAKEAMERAVALSPDGARSRLAKARYLFWVAGESNSARMEMDQALRSAPNDAEVLALAGTLDLDAGNLGAGLSNLERARASDPRSYNTLYALMQVYVFLGRQEDAIAAGSAAVALAPGNLQPVEYLAMVHLGEADTAGAREVVRKAIASGISVPSLAAYFAGYQEVSWMLEDAQRQLVFRMTPAAFDNDRAWWGQSLATAYWQQGDTVRARAYADSALAPSAAQVQSAPDDPQLRGLHALLFGYLGRGAEARAEIQRVLASASLGFAQFNYNLLNVAKAELALGDRERAMDHLEQLLKRGHYVTRKWLLVDPTFASLKGHPRFEQLVQGK
jgi:serine/threonine-protein kinase